MKRTESEAEKKTDRQTDRQTERERERERRKEFDPLRVRSAVAVSHSQTVFDAFSVGCLHCIRLSVMTSFACARTNESVHQIKHGLRYTAALCTVFTEASSRMPHYGRWVYVATRSPFV